MRTIILALCLPFLSTVDAQITQVGTSPGRLLVVRSLPTAGVKLYRSSGTGIQLYNLDLSPYLTLTYPALPDGYTYFDALYITEDLFDTDPGSIEVMMLTQSSEYVSGTRVIRGDGTIVFDDLAAGFNGAGGYSDLNGKPPLFTGDDGVAYMLLSSHVTGTGNVSKLFQLPGRLPCLECSDTSVGMAPQGMGNSMDAFSLFPNPTTSTVTVTYSLPEHTRTARLMVHDAVGKEILDISLNGSGNSVLDLSAHAKGLYRCTLSVDQRILATKAVVLTQ